jgi:hypothetical protein
MVRAEDNTIFGSVAAAKSAECAVCGKPLNFKEEKINDVESTVARHCGRIFTIGQSGQATIGMSRDPEYAKKEAKITEKQQKAKTLRRQGKSDEANKLDDEVREDAEKLSKENESSDEPKTSGQAEVKENKRSRF